MNGTHAGMTVEKKRANKTDKVKVPRALDANGRQRSRKGWLWHRQVSAIGIRPKAGRTKSITTRCSGRVITFPQPPWRANCGHAQACWKRNRAFAPIKPFAAGVRGHYARVYLLSLASVRACQTRAFSKQLVKAERLETRSGDRQAESGRVQTPPQH